MLLSFYLFFFIIHLPLPDKRIEGDVNKYLTVIYMTELIDAQYNMI